MKQATNTFMAWLAITGSIIVSVAVAIYAGYLISNIPAFNDFIATPIGQNCATSSASVCAIYPVRFMFAIPIVLFSAPFLLLGSWAFTKRTSNSKHQKIFLIVLWIPVILSCLLFLYVELRNPGGVLFS